MGVSMLLLAPICAGLVIGACFAFARLFANRAPRGDD